MISKKTKHLITAAVLSFTISLSFLGTNIKVVKAFDNNKPIYELKDAKKYEFVDKYTIMGINDKKLAHASLNLGSYANESSYQIDISPYKANIEIFPGTKEELEKKTETIKDKNKIYGIWSVNDQKDIILDIYIINCTKGLNYTLEISKEFISGKLDYNLYKTTDDKSSKAKDFTDKLNEVLNGKKDIPEICNDYKKYDSQDRIPYGNEKIKKKAEDLCTDSKTKNDMEKIEAIYKFVNNEIKNEKSEYIKKGSLKDEKGICEDFASLFVALCREVKIPARYVYGISAGSKYDAWPEFYLPYYGWIIAEPTASTNSSELKNDDLPKYIGYIDFGEKNNKKTNMPSHLILDYNNNPEKSNRFIKSDNYCKIYASNFNIKVKEDMGNLVYNQPFSDYSERLAKAKELLEKAKNSKAIKDIKEVEEICQGLKNTEKDTLLKELSTIDSSSSIITNIDKLHDEISNNTSDDDSIIDKLNKLNELIDALPSKELQNNYTGIYNNLLQSKYAPKIDEAINKAKEDLKENTLKPISDLLDKFPAPLDNSIKEKYLKEYLSLLNQFEEKTDEEERLKSAETEVKKVQDIKEQYETGNLFTLTELENTYKEALKSLNSLKNSEDKTKLSKELEQTKKYVEDKETEISKEQTKLVKEANNSVYNISKDSPNQGDINNARIVVDKLPNNTNALKNNLNKQLDELQAKLNEKVSDSSPKPSEEDIKKALEESLKKAKKALEDANSSLDANVKLEEKYKNYNAALTTIYSLNDPSDRRNLLKQLNAVKETMIKNEMDKKTLESVKKLFSSSGDTSSQQKSEIIYIRALERINKLQPIKDSTSTDTTTIKDLETKLNTIIDNMNKEKAKVKKEKDEKVALQKAEKLVVKAQIDKTEKSCNEASNAIAKVTLESDKTTLSDKIKNVKGFINKQDEKKSKEDALKTGTSLVEKAEKDKLDKSYNKALDFVEKLPSSVAKDTLLKRLSDVKNIIDKLKAENDALQFASELVAIAEKSNSESDFKIASDNVSTLTDSEGKKKLIERLNNVKKHMEDMKISNATQLVKFAEKNPSISSYKIALSAVNLIKNTSVQENLLDRLNNVKNIIDKLDEKEKKEQFVDYVENLIKTIETKKTEENYKIALEQAKQIQDVETRKVYINRLKEIESEISRQKDIKEIQVNRIKNKLDTLQYSLNMKDVDKLMEEISDIKDLNHKKDLIDKVVKIKNKYNKINNDKKLKTTFNEVSKINNWNKSINSAPTNKIFKVRFNQKIQSSYINSDNVYLVDLDSFEKIAANIVVEENVLNISSKKLEKNKKYVLVISDRMTDENNKKLSNPIKILIDTNK